MINFHFLNMWSFQVRCLSKMRPKYLTWFIELVIYSKVLWGGGGQSMGEGIKVM